MSEVENKNTRSIAIDFCFDSSSPPDLSDSAERLNGEQVRLL